MTTGYYETSILLFANARRAGTLLTVKCPASGTHRTTNVRSLPEGGGGGGMLAAGSDSHIIGKTKCKSNASFDISMNCTD